ncbi:MAG TPA: phosphopantetheine-binding protein [Candidatus Obscuribacterales bacterium]
MSTDEQAYELSILKKAINTYLDESLPFTEKALNSVVAERDEMVWKIATKIYSQSGHKVEFSLVRDIVDSRIEVLKKHIETEKIAAYERLQLQAQQIEEARRWDKAKEEQHWAEVENCRQTQEIEKAQRLAKEEQQRAEVENCRQNRLMKLAKNLEDSGKDKSMSELFMKVQDIISKELEVDLDYVTLDSHISKDLGADELDTVELAWALEEEFEFEIEIPEDILGSVKRWPPSFSNSFGDSYPVACTVGELLDFIHKQVSSGE